jgi:SAM-dependent methyltransferase
MANDVSCRGCGHQRLEGILSLGNKALANAYLKPEELLKPEPQFPLDLVFCPACSLVQITETVPPEVLFGEYLYFSSYSETAVRSAREIAERLVMNRHLHANSLVMEIASNDGYLLQFYKKAGIPVLGIEPAANIARVALQQRGIRTLSEFFGQDLALKLRAQGQRADVIHANNVLAHVADLNGVVEGVRTLLKDNGIAVIEIPYVKAMIDRCEFDTIYHEHLCYFSVTSLDALFQRHSLMIQAVETLNVHGGSLRLFIANREKVSARPRVEALLQEERAWGVSTVDYYQAFARRVDALRASLMATLTKLKEEGKRLAAYGAAAKGTMLLNYCGVGPDMIDFVADANPHKQGHLMPGVHIPIVAPQMLLEAMPDYVLLLVWNLADEIMREQKDYLQRGGKFVIPVPEVRITDQ